VKLQTGFTLLEVLVAMAIVGLGVVTLLEIFSMGLRLGAKSSERVEATAFGRQLMSEVLIRREIGEGREEGSLGEKLRWHLQVVRVREETELLLSAPWELRELTLQIRDPQSGESKVEMKTFRIARKEDQ
jgi:prepilin-type N-terminal cleavage/methylation domain-containing protein